MPLAVLVTGDRWWARRGVLLQHISDDDESLLRHTLDALKPDVLIQGGARGADQRAEIWALDSDYRPLNVTGTIPPGARLDIPRVITMRANWDRYGKAAGPVRNGQMLRLLGLFKDRGYDTDVIAFHHDLVNSKGTKHMVEIARKAGYHPTIVGGHE